MAGEWTPEVHLKQIVDAEAEVINRRRATLNQSNPGLDRKPVTVAAAGPNAPALEVTALALSGGGIRSASFAMGVLQALNQHNVLARIDYLSTVSGGGYMGAALTATMTKAKGAFVFGETTGARASSAQSDVRDTPAVGQVRNYSNYLIPFGIRDLLTAFAVIFRGLVANVSLVLPVILLAACVTIYSNPNRGDLLRPNVFGYGLEWLAVTHFGVTLLLVLLAFPLFLTWALYRSLAANEKQTEFRTWLPTIAAGYLVLIAVTFFCELQPYLVAGMFDLADEAGKTPGSDNSLLTAFVTWLAAIVTPIAAIVTFFRQQVGTLLKSVTSASGITTKLVAYGAQAALWLAGAALPLLIWVGYLHLCYWGIINKGAENAEPPKERAAVQTTLQIKGPGVDLRGSLDCLPNAIRSLCAAPASSSAPASLPAPAKEIDVGGHTPSWLLASANRFYDYVRAILPLTRLPDRFASRPITVLYFSVSLLLFLLSWLLMPNANSLHRLYRDRLSKAFLFDPDPEKRGLATGTAGDVDLGRDFAPLDTLRISELAPKDGPPYAPYHLINAALNVQGSDYANRRGRNADFFLFSPLFVGSEVTNYADTRAVEKETALDLATAMAISGAAFSSNMGANSIRPLTPTLALLNVRTGYWLKNPLAVEPRVGPADRAIERRIDSRFYLWSEVTGRLYEDSPDVYLTDGGHIENLGIYELLRRRCKVIVAVDAEADPAMRMPSFIALQRYARIDLGARITMPWDAIRKSTMCWMGYGGTNPENDDKPLQPCPGPHAAIGIIDYDGGEAGWLLYIKSSLSGDENNYVRDYARRYDQFPHESTGDQFFSEEQFEVYRALGFHIAYRLLAGEDDICAFDSGEAVKCRFNASEIESVKAVREALLGA